MQKTILFLIALFVTITLCAQMPDSATIATLQQQVCKLQIELKNQQTDFSKQLSTANTNIGNLQLQIESQKQTIAELADSLGIKIDEIVQNTNIDSPDIDLLFCQSVFQKFGKIEIDDDRNIMITQLKIETCNYECEKYFVQNCLIIQF
jgi:hypothetical protein